MSDNVGDTGRVWCWATTIGELISNESFSDATGAGSVAKCELRVPPYQRTFAWTSEHVRRMCKDLLSCEQEYHLGTIIMHCPKGKNVWMIVDGQQRLTTAGVIIGQTLLNRDKGKNGELKGFSARDRESVETALQDFESRNDELKEKLLKCAVVCVLVEDIAEAFQLFDTQNGRGKTLSPVNLLKAFHFHEYMHSADSEDDTGCERIKRLERRWEEANSMRAGLKKERLLVRVFAEHLYRLRCWCRGEFDSDEFSGKQLGEFKGVTVGRNRQGDDVPVSDQSLPVQNSAVLRKMCRTCFSERMLKLFCVAERLFPDVSIKNIDLDPFVSLNQAIVNGEDFFNYAQTYAEMYRVLFPVFSNQIVGDVLATVMHPALEEFRLFYVRNCLYQDCELSELNRRRLYRTRECQRAGDTYARHIYESLCLFAFDRFGQAGLLRSYKSLYRLSYFERATKTKLRYSSAGVTFAQRCAAAFLRSETLSELQDELCIMCLELDGMAKKVKDEGKCDFDGRKGSRNSSLNFVLTGRGNND